MRIITVIFQYFFLFGTITCENNTDVKPETIEEIHLGKNFKKSNIFGEGQKIKVVLKGCKSNLKPYDSY